MRVRFFGGLGALATLVAVAVVARPDLADALSPVVTLLESQSPERLLLGLGLVVGILAVVASRGGSSSREPTEASSARFEQAGDPPEVVSAADRIRTGESFDSQVRAACSGDDRALEEVRAALADIAANVLIRAEDRDPEQARRAVETGAWTDDSLAAAFLAGENGLEAPLTARLRAWLDPESERRRRIERTVEAVQQSAGAEEQFAGAEKQFAGAEKQSVGTRGTRFGSAETEGNRFRGER